MTINSRFPIILATPFLIMMPAWSQAAGDELWETRSSMVSSAHGAMDLGMNRECRSADWRDKPEFKAPGDKGECKSQQMERRGDGYVWKFDCGGSKGEGSARMLGRDRLEGQVLMDTPQGRFTLKMQSHKVGACKRG